LKGNKVRIGIDAPADVPVLRGELNDSCGTESSDESLSRGNETR
jgi:sRNA-binding carbon storage regulator CsrA